MVHAQAIAVQGRKPLEETFGLLKVSIASVISNKVPSIFVHMQALLTHGAMPSLATAIHAGYALIQAGRRDVLATFGPLLSYMCLTV